ncbi:MAG TPA: DUF885 domain-containing protein [Anaeromyxobacter sp.]
MRRALAVLPLAVVACATAPRRAADPAARVAAVADAYEAAFLSEQPEQAYLLGVTPPRHDGLSDNSPAWIASWQAREDAWLAALDAIDPAALVASPAWITHGVLREQLAAARQLRVCHPEWWLGVNHMFSWHLALARVAELQPVDTAEHREQALARWRKVPRYVRQEIENLRTGLAHGYSVPRPVAERMLAQIDGLAPAPGAPLRAHPYASPARRATDAGFGEAYLAVLEREVLPALRDFRAFLAGEYLPKARTTLAVTALPDGAACYRALLRANTTLDRPADEVYALGRAAVARYTDEVRAMGKRLLGEDDFAAIIRRVEDAPENHYADPEELLPDSRELVRRAQAAMPRLFVAVPEQPVVVEPIPAYEDGAGASSHYEPPTLDRPGVYRISLLRPGGTSRAEAEITAFHETWPGHHLQIAYAQRLKGLHPVTRLAFNSGYTEGWARYAEELAEEVGLYRSDFPKIARRAWPARGMVVDPGIHAMGWTREQAIAFLVESGKFDERSAPMVVDRIAALPGQLTSYDSGAQEFFALRREAEAALGARFDLRRFDDALLDHGTITLPMLRARMQRWIAEERARGEPR